MSTVAAAVAAIKARLVANWTTTPIAWPREPFEEPYGAAGQVLPWIYFDPETVQSDRLGVGPVYDRSGRVLIEVLSPANTGFEAAADLRSALTAIFADQYFNGIRTEVEEDAAQAGLDDDGNYAVSYIAIRWRSWG